MQLDPRLKPKARKTPESGRKMALCVKLGLETRQRRCGRSLLVYNSCLPAKPSRTRPPWPLPSRTIPRGLNLGPGTEQTFPLDTQLQSIWLPSIRAQVALNRNNPSAALQALQVAEPIEMGQMSWTTNMSCMFPAYIRGQAYLAARQGKEAATEFQKILDHSGVVWNCWTGALAHLGVARADALVAKSSQGADADLARTRALDAYKEFLVLWKDADPEIPILIAAKAEYAKLH